MKIAVTGAGISGLIASSLLSQKHEVTLFEKDDRVGGHTNTIEVPLPDGGMQPVDTGWIVYNGVNYPNLTALFAELGVKTRPTQMSFGVSLGGGAYEYMGSDRLWTVFAQASNLLSLTHIRMLIDILRLNALCRKTLASGKLPDGTLGEFLASTGLSKEMQSRYLLPMAGLIWSCSPKKAQEYPAADFMRFFDSHSLFTATQQPTWHTVVGGSYQYLRPLLERFKGELRLSTPVESIKRKQTGVTVRAAGEEFEFDHLICASHADQSLCQLGDDAGPEEREILGGIPYNSSRCVLHTDESFLPRRRAAWASWNYLNDVDEIHDRPISGSYWMNGLQGIPGPRNYIVTLNPTRQVAPEKVIYETRYEHPHYGPQSVVTHQRLPEIQGVRRTWFAGAWTQYGFHEDGLTSGLRVVHGLDDRCLPDWAVL